MEYSTLLFELEGGIGRLTLNRPDRLNAINKVMLDELSAFWREMHALEECRVIVVTGSGERGFCSGLDLKEATDTEVGFASEGVSSEIMVNRQNQFSGTVAMMRTCPQPVIAAVNGAAMGGGLSYALGADLRLASPNAKFCASYINIGLGGADMGSSYLLWRIVGWGMAAELLYTGKVIDAGEAHRIGLVNHVYGQEELVDRAMEMAGMMVTKTPLGLRLTKDALNAGLNTASLADALRMEDRNQVLLMQNLMLAGATLPESPPPGQRK